MQTVAFLSAIVGIVSVILWCLRNDTPRSDRTTTGWFAMREPQNQYEERGGDRNPDGDRSYDVRAAPGKQRAQ